MECSYPMLINGFKCPCGRCMACRINKKRLWTHRMILESYCHASSLFVTLTYNDENLPSDLSVHPKHVQLFLKRLRKAISPRKIRYFAVGEYGDKSMRPHYHLAIFGLGLESEAIIQNCWKYGFTMCGDLNPKSAGYIAGYVTKKMTSISDKRLLRSDGVYLHPEFVRMSLKPGLGVPALDKIVSVIKSSLGDKLPNGDVPTSLRHGNRIFPIGRYLRSKLRERFNFTDEDIELLKEKSKEEVRSLFFDFLSLEEIYSMTDSGSAYLLEQRLANPQQELNITAKLKLKVRKL